MDRPSLKDCKPNEVMRALERLGGLEVVQGAKHIKIKHPKALRPIMIPRKDPIDQNIMRAVVKDLGKLGYEEAEIFKHLWC